jgi:hypothetical protein
MSRKRSGAAKIQREKARAEKRLQKRRRKPLPEEVQRAARESQQWQSGSVGIACGEENGPGRALDTIGAEERSRSRR